MLKIASNRDMTSGSPLTVLINFTVPLLLGNLLQQTYSIVDAVIVGKFLGINSLAAVRAGTSVITLIFRYTIQGVGYTRLALFSGISEMLARTFVSVFAVPIFKFWAICFGDPIAWTFAVLFLLPAFKFVNRKSLLINN